MPEYSEQDLRYAAEFREEIHKEALEILRKTWPNAQEVIDPHPVEDFFQQNWEYPGKWYTIVAIPYGYRSRKAFVNALVENTLAGPAPESPEEEESGLNAAPEKVHEQATEQDPVYALLAEYPELAVEYFIVQADGPYRRYESHRKALKTAFSGLNGEWGGDPDRAAGHPIPAEKLFSLECPRGKLNYRKAFLNPPHGAGCTVKDFDRVNAALFPNGTDGLEVYEWDTGWSDYFDDGHEWWGTLCLTVYDKTLDRFAVILASATD